MLLRCGSEVFAKGTKTKAMTAMVRDLFKAGFEVDVAMVVNDDEQAAEEDQEDELAKFSADERSSIVSLAQQLD